jgi:hypothetical protein
MPQGTHHPDLLVHGNQPGQISMRE